jgi:hypothetical protein
MYTPVHNYLFKESYYYCTLFMLLTVVG